MNYLGKMTMRKMLLFFVFLCSINVLAQSEEPFPLPDSLAGRLREFRKNDFARAEALDAAIRFYQEIDKVQDAKGYIRELSSLAYNLKDNYYIALSDYYLAIYDLDRMDYEEALYRIHKALECVEMLPTSGRTERLTARLYMALGNYYSDKRMLSESYDAIQKGLEAAGENDREIYLKLINNLGNVYLKGGNSLEAERLYRESLKLHKSLPYRNMATIYAENQNYDTALIYTDSALMYAISSYDTMSVNHFKGVICLGKGDIAQASLYYDKCLRGVHSCSDAFFNSVVYQNSAYISMEKGDFEQAMALIDTAIMIANEMNNVHRKLDCLRLKAILLSEMNDLENSLKCMAEYSFTRDSILVKQDNERFLTHVHDYETGIIEQRYEAEKAIAKQRQGFILVIAVLIVFFTVMTTSIFIRNRRQKELLLKQELDLKNREVTSDSIGKIQSNEMLNDIIEKLTEMEVRTDKDMLPSVIRDLKTLVHNDAKKDFDLHFVQIHPDFYQKLLADYPRLTQNELRLCALIKSNLSVKEIAAINGISAESVKTARKRLRKSLNLTGEDESLLSFLSKY